MTHLSESQLTSRIQERLSDLIHAPRLASPSFTSPAETLQQILVQVLSALNRPGWSAYLVGGALRDFAIDPDGQRALHPRDIDILVSGANREQLQEALHSTLELERLTRFGGLHLTKQLPSGERVLFDIWAMKDNWGFQSKGVPARIENFPETTFLNIDSCAIELMPPEERPRTIYEKGFFSGILHRTLDINYAPNPYPHICAVRGLIMAARLDFSLAKPLAEYILQHIATNGIESLVEAQQSHYGFVRCPETELAAWAQQLQNQFDAGQQPLRLEVSSERRTVLWSHSAPGNSSR